MTEELETVALPEASSEGENTRLLEMLNSLESQAYAGRVLMDIGFDTDLVRSFREYVRNPQKVFDTMYEFLGKAFVGFFWEGVKEQQLSPYVAKMGVSVNGSRVDLWVFLKDECYTFPNRTQFYGLRASLCNSTAFSKIDADVHLLRESDAELPTNYTPIAF